MLRNLLFLFLGMFGGIWLAWPGIIDKDNWGCAKDIVLKSRNDGMDIRAALALSPKYFLRTNSNSPMEKIRVVGDACFR